MIFHEENHFRINYVLPYRISRLLELISTGFSLIDLCMFLLTGLTGRNYFWKYFVSYLGHLNQSLLHTVMFGLQSISDHIKIAQIL